MMRENSFFSLESFLKKRKQSNLISCIRYSDILMWVGLNWPSSFQFFFDSTWDSSLSSPRHTNHERVDGDDDDDEKEFYPPPPSSFSLFYQHQLVLWWKECWEDFGFTWRESLQSCFRAGDSVSTSFFLFILNIRILIMMMMKSCFLSFTSFLLKDDDNDDDDGWSSLSTFILLMSCYITNETSFVRNERSLFLWWVFSHISSWQKVSVFSLSLSSSLLSRRCYKKWGNDDEDGVSSDKMVTE